MYFGGIYFHITHNIRLVVNTDQISCGYILPPLKAVIAFCISAMSKITCACVSYDHMCHLSSQLVQYVYADSLLISCPYRRRGNGIGSQRALTLIQISLIV